MSNIVQDAAEWLGLRLQEAAGRTVTYTRGSDSFTIVGTSTLQQYNLTDSDGIATEIQSYDWYFISDELEIDGSAITPRPGDQISETLNGESVTWEVLEFNDNLPCVEWADTSGILLRVHSKRIG